MDFPITVRAIEHREGLSSFSSGGIGKFVSIRPCGEDNPHDLTFLGLYVGDLPISTHTGYDEENNILIISHGFNNPAIFVFGLNRIVYGAESWWGTIDTEDDLKRITNADIDDIWYVKAMRAIAEKE